MMRWSLIKRFNKVTLEEFQIQAEAFCRAYQRKEGKDIKITFEFFKEIPLSTTCYEDDMQAALVKDNDKKMFQKTEIVLGSHSPLDFSKFLNSSLFEKAVYIRLFVKTLNSEFENNFGFMECKGLIQGFVYYIQPEEIARFVQDYLFQELSLLRCRMIHDFFQGTLFTKVRARMRYAVGDGFENAHHVSLN